MGRDLIRLCNMQFYGRHGVNPEEGVLGQRFEVDVDLRVDTRPAALQAGRLASDDQLRPGL